MEWLIAVLAIAVGVPAAAWLMQDSLIFFPQPVGSTAHLPAHSAPFAVTAADGTRLAGWIAQGSAVPAPTVIYFGGNAEEVSHTLADPRWPRAVVDRRAQLPRLRHERGKAGRARARRRRAVDLRRHRGAGRRRQQTHRRLRAQSRNGARCARRRGAPGRGRHPGVAVRQPCRHRQPPLSVPSRFAAAKHRFDAETDARRCRMPMLTIVASSDSIIPVERSRALYDAWAGPKSWQVVPGRTTTRWETVPISGAA